MKYEPYMRVANGLWGLNRGLGMTELGLLDALVNHLTELFNGYELPSKSGLLQQVRVFAQFLPQPSGVTFRTLEDSESTTPQGYSTEDLESNFPCVVVKIDGVTDKEEGSQDQSIISVRFLIGVYDADPACQGYRDVFNIIETIRQDLLTIPARILDQRYRLVTPLTSYLFDEQPWPIFFGQMESMWGSGRPLMPNAYEISF